VISSLDGRSTFDAGRNRRGGDCLSHLTLDRFALAELPDDEARAVAAHLDRCARCAESHQVLTADRAAFAREARVPELAVEAMGRLDEQTVWQRFRQRLTSARPATAVVRWILRAPIPLAIGAGAGTAVLAVVLFVSPRLETRGTAARGAGYGTKGEFSLSAYVLHAEPDAAGSGGGHAPGGGGVRVGVPHLGETLHPGDRLQFRYNGVQPGYLAVLSIDAEGTVDVYYPPGKNAERVEAGRDVALRSAVELDGTVGREVIIGVRCADPLPVAEITGAVRREVERARGWGGKPTDLEKLGLPCAETRHEIAKSAAPPAPRHHAP
jgi:hypothetical protein